MPFFLVLVEMRVRDAGRRPCARCRERPHGLRYKRCRQSVEHGIEHGRNFRSSGDGRRLSRRAAISSLRPIPSEPGSRRCRRPASGPVMRGCGVGGGGVARRRAQVGCRRRPRRKVFTRDIVRVLRRLAHGQDRRVADVGLLHQRVTIRRGSWILNSAVSLSLSATPLDGRSCCASKSACHPPARQAAAARHRIAVRCCRWRRTCHPKHS